MKVVKILAALVAAISILNSSGASPGATEKVAALVVAALVTALYTPYQLKDPSPTIPTYINRKGKRAEDYSRDRAA